MPETTMLISGSSSALGVWKRRCNVLLDSTPWPLDVAWCKICQERDGLLRIHRLEGLEGDHHKLSKFWHKPSTYFVKLNVDDSYREDINSMGGGGVFRNNSGDWV